ncbi:MAG TPA: hypothetical protein DCQ83_04840 [Fibrobacteres bacterium]|jgi:phospholipid/cholesterol/gamma-HCH transport system substrate-binding protein|nr:hypothetical protein [Fibrobacterota bacterium]
MEATRAEKARLGIFIIALCAAFFVSIAFLVGMRLAVKTDLYFTRLEESVTGLESGSTVKQNGVDIGKVVSITTDSGDVQKSIVKFRVTHGTPMKSDMTASLGSYGITGLKYLEITGGSYGASNVAPGGEVRSSLSMIGRFTLRADSIAIKVDRLLGNAIAITETQNREHLNHLMESSASLAASLDSLTRDIQGVRPGRHVAKILDATESAVEELRGKIHRADIDGTLKEYRQTAQAAQKAVQTLDATARRTQEDLGTALISLKEALKNMEVFTRQIRDNPSLLLRGEDKQERRR